VKASLEGDNLVGAILAQGTYLRASLIAPSLASAPELAKNTRSKQLISVSAFASFKLVSL
jgi:hypothetical protein